MELSVLPEHELDLVQDIWRCPLRSFDESPIRSHVALANACDFPLCLLAVLHGLPNLFC